MGNPQPITTPEVIGWIIVGIGLLIGAVLVGKRASFWAEFVVRLSKVLGPLVWAYLTKRMTAEQEDAKNACLRSGGKWDNFRKRCRD